MINKTVIKMAIAASVCMGMLVTSSWLLVKPYFKAHMQDCEHVKETCNRKKGCKCKLNCDPEGRRLPPAGGTAECPSYCCEEKCECHAMGCP